MTTIDFVALLLAASAVVDAWTNGSLFADIRAYFQARADGTDAYHSDPPEGDSEAPLWPTEATPRWMAFCDRWVPDLFCELVSCHFCLSHHTPWILAAGFYVPALFLPEPWTVILKIPVYSLAATRAGNIINSLVPKDAQYAREDD